MIINLPDKNGENVISIEVARERFDAKHCKHRKVTVDEKLSYLKCRDCKETVNPIWWITRLAQEWWRVKNLYEQNRRAAALFEEKQRTRCEHCGRFTKVNAPEHFHSNLRKMGNGAVAE